MTELKSSFNKEIGVFRKSCGNEVQEKDLSLTVNRASYPLPHGLGADYFHGSNRGATVREWIRKREQHTASNNK
ncbi:hypothetical protein [Legionella waltersii]|uniref:Uncharacterized protein n=1 Tax=Legionella waltersii TaxID=66969 RepID=A0A0W1AAK6_9GAMM|nr:hypothetical protein [Legionella waltersii]KTD78394.1 hypothetical protein Lwal_1829 [Legionella waltersii]